MMYMMTPEQHKQVQDAAESNAEYAEAEYLDRREFWGEALDYRWKNLQAASEQAKVTLAALKAMQPVEPTFYMSKHQSKPRFYREGETLPTNVVELYTPTKD